MEEYIAEENMTPEERRAFDRFTNTLLDMIIAFHIKTEGKFIPPHIRGKEISEGYEWGQEKR